jgi:hypothetical protein
MDRGADGRVGDVRRLTQLLRDPVPVPVPGSGSRRPTDLICDPAQNPPLVTGYLVAGRLVAAGADAPSEGLRLVRDVLDVQVLDRQGRHRGRVGEVELALDDGGRLRVVGVETGLRPVLARCGLGWLWRDAPSQRIAWAQLEPSLGRARALVSQAGGRPARYHRVMRVRRRAPS